MTDPSTSHPPSGTTASDKGPRPYLYVITGGLVLGIASFLGDVLPGAAGDVITAIFSTASAWCLLSVVAAYQCSRLLHSVRAGITLLLIATVAYYALTAVSGQRFGGYTSSSGSGSGPVFTESSLVVDIGGLLRGVVFWVAASLVAGTVMGLLGNVIHTGSRTTSTIAAGISVGIVAGPGLEAVLFLMRWGINDTTAQNILPAVCQLGLAAVCAGWVIAVRRARLAWGGLVVATLLAGIAVTLLWELVNVARGYL